MIERELRLLIEENAIKEVTAVRQSDGGYVIQINGRTLKSARREERHFARLDTAADLLHKFGIERFIVLKSDAQEKGNSLEGSMASVLTGTGPSIP